MGWSLASKLVFKKVRGALGLDRCGICISAAAPIMKDTLEFFMSLNIPVTEIYGMSESLGTKFIACEAHQSLTVYVFVTQEKACLAPTFDTDIRIGLCCLYIFYFKCMNRA